MRLDFASFHDMRISWHKALMIRHPDSDSVHVLVVVTGAVVVITVVTTVPAEVNLVVVFSVVVTPVVLVDTTETSSGKQLKQPTESMLMVSTSSSTISGTIFTAVATILLGRVMSIMPFSSLSYTYNACQM